MKSTALVYVLAAASLSFASLSFAQDHEHRGAGGEARRIDQRSPMAKDGRVQQRDERQQQRAPFGRDDHNASPRSADAHQDARNDDHDTRNKQRGFDQRDARNDRHYFNGHGSQFQRGGRIPAEYRHRQYAVNDWHPHHLSAPPRGHQWVQVGTDYALIAIATGIIAQLVLSR